MIPETQLNRKTQYQIIGLSDMVSPVVVLLIFTLPMIVAAMLIAPLGVHDLVRSLVIFSAMSAVIAPIAAWRTFLIEFGFPSSEGSRLGAVIRLWIAGTLLLGAVFTLIMAVLGYSPIRPGPNPRLGFWLAEFTVSMFVSCGVWGAFAPVFAREALIRGAVMTGGLLFVAVATLGYVIFG
jgi:hypothetical protein